MKITEIKIVEIGVHLKIRVTINGLTFYSIYGFETEEQARKILKKYGIQEI